MSDTDSNQKPTELLIAINKLLFEFDLMRLDFGDNLDEYDFEAKAILELLTAQSTPKDTLNIVYKVFKQFFGKDVIPEKPHFIPVAEAIWLCLQKHYQTR